MQFYRKPLNATSKPLLSLVGDVDKNGLRTGLWHAYRKDGSLYWEKGFDQGRLEGINRYYHPDKSIAIDSTFQGGLESDIKMIVPKDAKTDIPGFDQSLRGLVRFVNISDGRYGYTNIEFYGADDTRITADGAPFPKLPEGVPLTAQYNAGNTETKDEPFWSDGVLERGTNEKLGLHRYWSAQGEPTLRVLYDDRGTERWRHSVDDPHPQTLRLEAFLAADPDVLNSTHLLWKIWTPDLHTRFMARLAEATDEVVDVYLYGINQHWVKRYATQKGWVDFELLTLEVIDAWRKRTKSPSGKAAEKILWRELALRVRVFDKKRIKAIWKGLKDKEISYQNEHLASKTKSLLSGELVQIKPEKRAGIEERRENYGNYARYLRAYDRIDERGLYWSGKNVWWTFYRFGTSLMLQGTKYYPDRGQAEVIYDSFIQCDDYDSMQRRLEGFKAMMPSGARPVDPYFHVKKGWAIAWSYESYAPGNRDAFTGGVHNNNWIDGNDGKVIETYSSPEEAKARFERYEFEALKTGYYLQRLYALPIAEPKVTKKRRAKKAPEPVVNTGKIAKNVVPQLTRAAEAAEAGDVDRVIKHLGEAWRARPVPAIADILDSCSKSVQTTHTIGGSNQTACEAWTELEKQQNPVDLEVLLSTLLDPSFREIAMRLERLFEWPEDPRLDRALINIASEVPFTSSGSQIAWRRIFKRLLTSRDARILKRLSELADRYKKIWDTKTGEWGAVQAKKIVLARTPTLEALLALTLSPDEAELLTRAKVTSSVDSEESAVNAVFASPNDDELRRVLVEIPDSVRGRIVGLQDQESLDRAEKKELKTLLKNHESELLGRLAKHTLKGAGFRLGFASQLHLKTGTKNLDDCRYWRTVERLELGSFNDVLSSPHLVSLRELRGFNYVCKNENPDEWLQPLLDLPNSSQMECLGFWATWPEILELFKIMPTKLPQLRRLESDKKLQEPINFETAPAQLNTFILHGDQASSHTQTNADGDIERVHSRDLMKKFLEAFRSGAGHLKQIGAQIRYNLEWSPATVFTFSQVGDTYTLEVTMRKDLESDALADNIGFLLLELEGSACTDVFFVTTRKAPNFRSYANTITCETITLDLSGVK